MAGLQRSETTFRRSGSSGMVWDEMFLSGNLTQMKKAEEDGGAAELRHSKSAVAAMGRRSRSTGGRQAFRTSNLSPAAEPPSPRVSAGCLCCGLFAGKNRSARLPKPRRR